MLLISIRARACGGVVVLGARVCSVALDDRRHDTSNSLNTKRKGSDIEEEQVLGPLRSVTLTDSSLDGGTICDGLIRVDRLVAEEVGHEHQKYFQQYQRLRSL